MQLSLCVYVCMCAIDSLRVVCDATMCDAT